MRPDAPWGKRSNKHIFTTVWIRRKKMFSIFTFVRVYVFNQTLTSESIICNIRPWVYISTHLYLLLFFAKKRPKSTSFYNTQRGKDCFGISCCSSQRFPGFGAPSHMAWISYNEYHTLYYILYIMYAYEIWYINIIHSSLSYGLNITY